MSDNYETVRQQVFSLCKKAKSASPSLASASGQTRNGFLAAFADTLSSNETLILEANRADVEQAQDNGISLAMTDRLRLDSGRIAGICEGIRSLIGLSDPIGGGSVSVRPNGLEIKKISVPLGVVGTIFESRPNVAADIAALCIKSGNCAVLRGGKEAANSNRAITDCARRALAKAGLPEDCISLIDFGGRDGATALMEAVGLVDVLIPRGGKGLIRSVTDKSKVPVIETGAGNCHIYVHSDADTDMAVKIAVNAKTQRPAVCNAAETFLVHKDAAEKFLPAIKEALKPSGTEIRGCGRTVSAIGCSQATEEDFATEYDDLIVSVKVVDSLDEAIEHINRYSTAHSEAIITSSISAAERFTSLVDSACVYVNASTRFTDGGEFGFGAEVGISTQKLHVRGPMGLSALTTCKYIINGNGQIR